MEYNFLNILLFSLAAITGASARYGINALLEKYWPSAFPWGIFAVNVIGCFGFGLVWAMGQYFFIDMQLYPILLVGFMGAFTTFSTLIFDCHRLATQKFLLFINVFGQIVIGFMLFIAAVELVKFWV